MHVIRFTQAKFFFDLSRLANNIDIISQRRKIIIFKFISQFSNIFSKFFFLTWILTVSKTANQGKNSSLAQGDFLAWGSILGISDSLACNIDSVRKFSIKLTSLLGGSSLSKISSFLEKLFKTSGSLYKEDIFLGGLAGFKFCEKKLFLFAF